MTDSQLGVLADPFAMLVRPEAVLQAIEKSGRLGALASRICRPLDKPLIPKRDGESQHTFDEPAEAVDSTDMSEITRY